MRIFYDVDTQNDFMNKDGALYVPDAELIKPNLAELTRYARANNIPVVGSVDRHFGTEEYKERELEMKKWGGPFPDHCMSGTKGEEKIDETADWFVEPKMGERLYQEIIRISNPLLKRINYEEAVEDKRLAEEVFNRLPYEHKKAAWDKILPWKAEGESYETQRTRLAQEKVKELFDKNDFSVFAALDKVANYYLFGIDSSLGVNIAKLKEKGSRPLYFEKQSYDVFTNPNLEIFLERAGIKEAVVYGVATDYCVQAVVLGMQARNIQCYVVEDAIKGVAPETTKQALEAMVKAGARFVTTKQVLEDEQLHFRANRKEMGLGERLK